MLDGFMSFVEWCTMQLHNPLGAILFPLVGLFVGGLLLNIFRFVKSFNIFN